MEKTKHIGTSGYNYSFWRNKFYPDKLPPSKWLTYYATQFDCVELNGTFYKFPTVANLKKSAANTPEHFKFSVKAHKIITHTRRLKDVREKIEDFMQIVIEGLGEKVACILFQLPPSYSFSEERMLDIRDNLSEFPGNVIEFRHLSWWSEEAKILLEESKLNICSVSFPGLPDNDIGKGHINYKRMHGVPELFKSEYSIDQLKHVAADIQSEKEAYVFFNNTYYEAGYTNAMQLKKLV